MKVQWTKAEQDKDDPFLFVASSDAEDRMGDTIMQEGWDLRNFKKNPIALWAHDHRTPIGVWENVKVEGNKLMARLKMAAPRTSPFIDTLRSLLEQRILRAVSVGFMPLKAPEEIVDDKGRPTGGLKFTKQELLEISVVSIPANQEALATARAKGLGAEDISRLFGKSASERRRDALGPNARSSIHTNTNGNTNMKLKDKIAAKEAEINSLKDKITELSGVEGELTDQQDVELEEASSQLTAAQKQLGTFKKAEAALAQHAEPADEEERGNDDEDEVKQKTLSRPAIHGSRAKKLPAQMFFRSAAAVLRGRIEGRSPFEIMQSNYGQSKNIKDLELFLKTVTAPALTSVAGWAQELVATDTGEFLDILRPQSIFFNMPMTTYTFNRAKIKLPNRQSGTLAGDFVGEAAPIPVKQLTLSSTTLEPYKLGVISVFSREIAALSDPAIDPLLRDIMTGDTRDTIDTLFLDNTAAVAGVRPAGLQVLAGANTVASSGTSLANVITDLKAALAAMSSNNMGRSPVWIMNVQRVLSLSLMTNAAGNFMFRDELAQGRLMGIPVLSSTSVPAAIVFLVDAAEMAAAFDTLPTLDASEQATLHMETAPTALSATGTPNTVAAPVRSLFQTATIALRLLWEMTWAQRRAGAVFTITGVAW